MSLIASNQKIIYYNIIDQETQYKLAMDGLLIGDYALSIFVGLLDTGNTCISIPDIFKEEILNTFNQNPNNCTFIDEDGNAGFKLLVCLVSNFDLLPIIRLRIGTEEYQIPKEYYL
jgi:hypothetical protein